jgi:hypothetical protein
MILSNQHYKALGSAGHPQKGGMPFASPRSRTADMGSSNPPLAGAVPERQSAKGHRAAPWNPAPRVAVTAALAERRRATDHDPSHMSRRGPSSLALAFVELPCD